MDTHDAQGRLEQRLDELLARAGHIGADLLGLHSADSDEAAVEAFVRDAPIADEEIEIFGAAGVHVLSLSCWDGKRACCEGAEE